MSCRLPKQLGVARSEVSNEFENKQILFPGLFTRAIQISAKWAGMRTFCLDVFTPFDLKKTADYSAELWTTNIVPKLARITIPNYITNINQEDLPNKLLEMIDEIKTKYDSLNEMLKGHKFDFVYPDSYLFQNAPIFQKILLFKNCVRKIDDSKLDEFYKYLNSLNTANLTSDATLDAYLCTVDQDSIEILMRSMERFENLELESDDGNLTNLSMTLPKLKSIISLNSSSINPTIIQEIERSVKNFGLNGLIEFIFETSNSGTSVIKGIRPYLDHDTVELFEAATGINLISLDLLISSRKNQVKAVITEAMRQQIYSAFDADFKWNYFRFFSPTQFAVFADIGGFGFRDYPMPGDRIPKGFPICTLLYENQRSEETENLCINSRDGLISRYLDEQHLLYKILGLYTYLQKT